MWGFTRPHRDSTRALNGPISGSGPPSGLDWISRPQFVRIRKFILSHAVCTQIYTIGDALLLNESDSAVTSLYISTPCFTASLRTPTAVLVPAHALRARVVAVIVRGTLPPPGWHKFHHSNLPLGTVDGKTASDAPLITVEAPLAVRTDQGLSIRAVAVGDIQVSEGLRGTQQLVRA